MPLSVWCDHEVQGVPVGPGDVDGGVDRLRPGEGGWQRWDGDGELRVEIRGAGGLVVVAEA